ncbi:MAG: hypothetical protein ACYCOU_24995, partial [Sulfobacillus sp.]
MSTAMLKNLIEGRLNLGVTSATTDRQVAEDVAFEDVLALVNEPKATTWIFVTDGVPSGKEGENEFQLSNQLWRIVQKNWQVSVVGYESHFRGPFFTTTGRKFKLNRRTKGIVLGNIAGERSEGARAGDLVDWTYDGDRPFYLFVFSPSQQDVEHLLPHIKPVEGQHVF